MTERPTDGAARAAVPTRVPDGGRSPHHGRAPLVTYAYAIGRAADVTAASDLPAGVAQAPVRPLTDGALGALVSSLPAERFGETSLAQRLNDLAELEEMARAHHEVVAAAHRAGVALPLRLATVYDHDQRLAAVLRDRGSELHDLLGRLSGRAEYGVKVYAVEAGGGSVVGTNGSPGDAETSDGQGGPGRAYLRRRRAERDARRSAQEEAAELADRVARIGDVLATARADHRPQQGALATGPGENVANLAFLLPQDRAGAFVDAVRVAARAHPHARVELTGPWAPYSFAVGLPTDGPREGEARRAG